MKKTSSQKRQTPISEHRFFFASSLMCLTVALIGFGPGFVHAVTTDITAVPLRIHLHGAVMMAWLLLFVQQARLVKRHSVRLHKRMGKLSVVLFSMVIISDVVISLNSLTKVVPPHIDTLINNLFSLQVVAVLLALTFYSMAIYATRSDLSAHKRYMLILAILFLEAAFARMQYLPGLNFLDNGVVMAHVYHSLLFAPLIVYDLSQQKRLHPATVKGLTIIIVGKGFTLWAWDNPAWLTFANHIEGYILPFWPAM
ncbi:hypothetical protein [Alteromonas sp. H39]|uniref:hypothetical protein n=1 Tax=Alteromonas sp. H39 TaxID=3389876 RepID=UPI0039DFCCB7